MYSLEDDLDRKLHVERFSWTDARRTVGITDRITHETIAAY